MALERGEEVKLSGFGNFDLREKKELPGRNPKTGEAIPISARRVVTFRPGQKLKARVEAYAGPAQPIADAATSGERLATACTCEVWVGADDAPVVPSLEQPVGSSGPRRPIGHRLIVFGCPTRNLRFLRWVRLQISRGNALRGQARAAAR